MRLIVNQQPPNPAAKPTTLPKFNPSKSPLVDQIKGDVQKLLDQCDELKGNPEYDPRCLANAATRFEEACMWMIKSLFQKKTDGS
jgi:hypothetical protein